MYISRLQLELGTVILEISGTEYSLLKKTVQAINSLLYNNHTEEYFKNMQLLKAEEIICNYTKYKSLFIENSYVSMHEKVIIS